MNSGAELLVCPDNTVHQAIDLIRAQSPAPWLHIAHEVGAVAAKRSFKRLGILGNMYLMEGPVYTRALIERNIVCDMPDVADRQRINAIIFDELVQGEFKGTSRRYFQDVVDKLADRGCDAVVLGCTEIPLLITQADSRLPVIDSTQLSRARPCGKRRFAQRSSLGPLFRSETSSAEWDSSVAGASRQMR